VGADETMTLEILFISESRCVDFNPWEAMTKDPNCSTCASAICEPASIPITTYSFIYGGEYLISTY